MDFREAKHRFLHEMEEYGRFNLVKAIENNELPECYIKQMMRDYHYGWQDMNI